ncbi:MAG: transcription elongation factor GreA [Chloroflexota bacterium]
MSEKLVSLTPEGRARLEAELDQLRTERRAQVVQRLHAAREDSEAWDNPEVQEAKNELSFVDGRIQELEHTLAHAAVIEHRGKDVVELGAKVTLRADEDGEEEVYYIVGSAEAQPAEGRISDQSPVGKALLGHHKGERVMVTTPAGSHELIIDRID